MNKKHFILLTLCFLFSITTTAQKDGFEIISTKKKIEIEKTEKGKLIINVPNKKIKEFKNKGVVSYNDFGATKNIQINDITAIAATHAFANTYNLKVKANSDAKYYIDGEAFPVFINTDTDFGNATFIINDRNVEHNKSPIFIVTSNLKPYPIKKPSSLKRNQKKISVSFPSNAIITIKNDSKKQYIRYGLNQNNGDAQTDIFLVDKNGNVAESTPIIWDFENITKIKAKPVDKTKLTIKGGVFITIANNEVSKYNYYHRNIIINRSNVDIEGLQHFVKGEKEQGAPYRGFLSIQDCTNIMVKNCVVTGRKVYKTIGSAGKPVSMGSYDISVNRALNVSFINCKQTNNIYNSKYWGIMASNYSKNILLDNCTFSRFDAHKGVANATIKNSTLGYMGINTIGTGIFLVENTTISSGKFINLRQDYGSTWEGEIIIRNCIFKPIKHRMRIASIFSGSYTGKHNFGYTCYMPSKITIENLHIDDDNNIKDYKGFPIFSNFNPKMRSNTYKEEYPYIRTKKIILKNVSTSSKKPLRTSNNLYFFKDIVIQNL